MRALNIFIFALFIGISSNAQTATAKKLEPYDFDTTLKGGYTISFKADDSLQYLFLSKSGRTVGELASTSRGMLYKNLGYVGADFKDYFVLVHSFGPGNPNYIELIKKSTGKNIIQKGAVWIDVNMEKECLLYSNVDLPVGKDKMILYQVSTGQKHLFDFPGDILNSPEIFNRIHIDKLTDKQLVIRYETEKGSKTKTYSR